jgi:hypothetical protein
MAGAAIAHAKMSVANPQSPTPRAAFRMKSPKRGANFLSEQKRKSTKT